MRTFLNIMSQFDISAFSAQILSLISLFAKVFVLGFNLIVLYSIYKLFKSTPHWLTLTLTLDSIITKINILLFGPASPSSSSNSGSSDADASSSEGGESKWKRMLRYAAYLGFGIGVVGVVYYFLKSGGSLPSSSDEASAAPSSSAGSCPASPASSSGSSINCGLHQLVVKTDYHAHLKELSKLAGETSILVLAALYFNGDMSLDFGHSFTKTDNLGIHEIYAHKVAEFHLLCMDTLERLAEADKMGLLTTNELSDIIHTGVSIANEDVGIILGIENISLENRHTLAINMSMSFYEGLISYSPAVEDYIQRHYMGSPNFPMLPWTYND